jgi:hypothetical protein
MIQPQAEMRDSSFVLMGMPAARIIPKKETRKKKQETRLTALW